MALISGFRTRLIVPRTRGGPVLVATARLSDVPRLRQNHKYLDAKDKEGSVLVPTAGYSDVRYTLPKNRYSHPMDKVGPVIEATAGLADDLFWLH